MNPANVPPWGCPWHGLVKGGQLQLPNGTSMAYRQPSGGDTTLVAHPDAQGAAGLSVEQQAAAAEAGMQWWDRAIISGGQLHGQGAWLSWLYIDPTGAVWMVDLEDSGTTLRITLDRFGVLGGAPQKYTYSVPTPLESPGGRLTVRHTTKTGDKAVISNAGPTGGGAWAEVLLSGPGGSCAIATEVKYSWAEGFGSDVSNSTAPPKVIILVVDNDDKTPPPEGYKRYLDTVINESEESRFSDYFGPRGSWVSSDSSVKDRVISGFYTADNALMFLKADYGYRIYSTADYKLTESTPGELRERPDPRENVFILATGKVEQSRTDRQELFFKVYAGSALVFSESVWRETRKLSKSSIEASPFSGISSIPGSSVTTTQYEWSSGWTGPENPQFGGAAIGTFPYVEGWRRQNGTTTRIDLRAAVASNTLTLVRISDLGLGKSEVHSVTPSGGQYHGTLNATRNTTLYGSWCPMTGQAAVDFSPVCWV